GLASVRQRPLLGRVVYFYVVDEGGRLQGVVPTRRLLLSPPDTPVADIMVRQVIAIPAEATVLDACEFFIQHRFLAFPVVDAQRRIVGVVDIELYTEKMTDLAPLAPVKQLIEPLTRFLQIESASGVVLLICTVVALFSANSPWANAYAAF